MRQVYVCKSGLYLPCLRSFLLLAQFWHTWEKMHESSKIFVEHVQPVALVQLPTRPTSCALETAGSVMSIALSKKWIQTLEKPVSQEKTRLTSPKVQPEATSMAWCDSGRVFSFPLFDQDEDKRSLCLQGGLHQSTDHLTLLLWHIYLIGVWTITVQHFKTKKKYLHHHRTCCNPLKQFLFLLKFFDMLKAKLFIFLITSTIQNTNNNTIIIKSFGWP